MDALVMPVLSLTASTSSGSLYCIVIKQYKHIQLSTKKKEYRFYKFLKQACIYWSFETAKLTED